MPVTRRKTRPISLSRQAAFDVLMEVESGGYASDLLRAATVRFDPRDAALTGQIVFGVLRFKLQLDYLIFLYSGRRTTELDLPVTQALRTAIFQLRFLHRIPAHAAVGETVELVKRSRRSASGFANAVLRKVRRDPVAWPDRATELSCPAFLLDRWDAHFGRNIADGIAQAALQTPDEYIRVPPGEAMPPGMTLEPTEVAGAFRITGGERPPGLRLHDIGSQSVVPALQLQPGDRYLDLCAAPGNKTRQALETRLGIAIACDISYSRLQTVGDVCPRVVLDGTEALPFPAGSFNRVFIDAPCSGTGTTRRNPEIKWRVTSDDLARFSERQIHLIERALKVLSPGGLLLYATCSLEKEENEDVVAAVCERNRGVVLERTEWRMPGRHPGDGFYMGTLRVRST